MTTYFDKKAATQKIKSILGQYKQLSKSDNAQINKLRKNQHLKGKLYEMHCLALTIEELVHMYGYTINLIGSSLIFQASPGHINKHKPYFEVRQGPRLPVCFEIFTDVQFLTMGYDRRSYSSSRLTTPTKSDYHEIDILVVLAGASHMPSYKEVVLGIECKSTSNFSKSIVKEALGIRRELSLLKKDQVSTISQHSPKRFSRSVPAAPASEYWLAYCDPKGDDYKDSPAQFGVRFCHWAP